MDTIAQDIRYAARKLIRTPGFTMVAIATLALAIGATTAVYSIVDGVLLKPLPFGAPQRLVRLESTDRDGKPFPLSPADYLDFRDQATSFAAVAQFNTGFANFASSGGDPVRLDRLMVGPNFFSVLGLAPLRGRFFASNEGAPGVADVVVISENLWRSRFAQNPNIVGQSITLDERPTTIIGIAPSTATYPQATDIFTPRVYQPSANPDARGMHQFFAVARLKDGVTVARAREEVRTIARRLGQQYPEMDSGFTANVVPLQEQLVGDLRRTLFAILGAVAFVLLIACANVANLLLVRASSRSAEMAVRTALGAGTARIVRQLVTESLLLTAAGAAVGVALATWVVNAIKGFGPRLLPRLQDVAVNGRVLGVTALVAVGTGLIFGIVPAVYTARPDIAAMLRESVRGSSRGGVHRMRNALVVAEMALAVVLLVGAGLLIRSFVTLMHVDLGFRTENVVTFDLPQPPAKYATDHARVALVNDVMARIGALPGTQSVGVTAGRPLARMMMLTNFDVVGEPPKDPMHRTIVEVHAASPAFFEAMGIAVRSGRLYAESENRRDARPVVVVNQEFAKRYFPGRNPVGKGIILGVSYNEPLSPGDTSGVGGEIVGVVSDVKQRGLSQDAFPSVYVPYNALPSGMTSVVVRTHAPSATVEPAIRALIAQIDTRLPVVGMNTMSAVVADSVAQPRFYMTLLTAFAVIALVLAAIGIYGVISYSVAQRARELGIRIALGASRRRVLRLVIGEGIALTVVGVGIGLAAAFALTRVIRSMLFGIAAVDGLTFAAVAMSLIAVALLASWLPARRA
ncbi:MAG TPA: ABC transporter permease, partial [Gemmatimonadaceae bacterium]|nr:ABC transporter permease [Gemmatimonadaceae bacterium]